MNTEQIIKALEVCTTDQICTKCPYGEGIACADNLLKDVLALIKEQQEELTFCYDKLTELEKECLGLSLHNITLKKEKKYLEDRLKEELEIKEDMSVSELKSEIERLNKEVDRLSQVVLYHEGITQMEVDEAKAETVKRMQEMLKQTYDREHIETGRRFVSLEIVDLVAKEMLEEER